MSETSERLCARCGHPDDWHRHDDLACPSEHPQPCAPAGCSSLTHPTHDSPFRCLGYDVDGPGFRSTVEQRRCDCPDFQEA